MYAPRQRLLFKFSGFLLLSLVVLFFGYHIFSGERGLLARPELDRKIALAKERLSLLNKHRDYLTHRIGLLQSDSVDADLLEEKARDTLGLFGPNDVIITPDGQDETVSPEKP